MKYLVLDTETLGLKEEAPIVSIAYAQLSENLDILRAEMFYLWDEKFMYYINTHRGDYQGAVDVHGLSAEWLRENAQSATDVMDRFYTIYHRANVIGYNTRFDTVRLNNQFRKYGYVAGPNREYDVMRSITQTVGKTTANGRAKFPKLAEAVEFFNLPVDGAYQNMFGLPESGNFHNAGYDVAATYGLTLLNKKEIFG